MAYRLVHMTTTLLIGSGQCMRHVEDYHYFHLSGARVVLKIYGPPSLKDRDSWVRDYCSCLFKNGVTWMKSFGTREISFLVHAQSKNLMNELSLQLYKLSPPHSTNSIGTNMFMYKIFIAEKSRFVFTVWILLWSFCQGDLFAFSWFLVFILLSSSSVNNRIGGIFSLCIKPQPHLSYVRCKFRDRRDKYNTTEMYSLSKCIKHTNVSFFLIPNKCLIRPLRDMGYNSFTKCPMYLKKKCNTIIKYYTLYFKMISLTSLLCLMEIFPPRSVLLLAPILV